MRVVLWDTRKLGVSKDFAGGYGVGQYPGGGGLRQRIIRRYFTRDRRPVALLFAHLAAIFRQLGWQVQYVEDRLDDGADLYVFCPSLITVHLECQAIRRLLLHNPQARVLVVGRVASVMPETFDALNVTVVKGEAEQLLWRLEDVLARPGAIVQLGTIEDLDRLPLPDWSPFRPWRFSIAYDFWRFPTALIQAGRGCMFPCDYCPYAIQEDSVRFRDPQAVVDEIRHGVRRWGFRSFKFRDPLFGLSGKQVFRLAELIGRLPQRIQFSVETRIDLMRPEMLRVLKRAGLSSVTVGIETPDAETLRRHGRPPIDENRQHQFIAACREMGIRTVAGFMIGFPGDTEKSIYRVIEYAQKLNPTFANFNIVTPYPGTEFYARFKDRIAHFDYSRYTVYAPVLNYEHLTAKRIAALHAKSFNHFYFRREYLRANAHLLWPGLQRFGLGHKKAIIPDADAAHPGVPQPLGHTSAEVLRRKGLRRDGPHQRDGLSNADQRRPTE